MAILGLDIGTTGTKAVLFREDGEVIGRAYREYDLVSPQPGWLELDPRTVIAAVREVVGRAAVLASEKRDPIRSLGICTLGEAAVPVDAHHEPVANAIVGFEARGKEELEAFRARLDEERVFAITGHGYNASHTLFKILWRRRETPDVFARTKKFLCFGDFAAASFGLEPRTDHSIAARTLAFDIHRREWSEEILSAAALDPSLFARPIAPGDVVGELGANDLGLPAGTIVGGGLHDQPAGILGSGVRPGEAMLATGTVICLGVRLTTSPDPKVMVASNLCEYPTFGANQRISIAFNFTGGSLLKWYRDTLGTADLLESTPRGANPYDVICEGLPDAPTGLLVLPHFSMTGTPWFDERALGSIHGLRLTTTRKEIVKAILEGLLFEIRLNSELLRQAGVEIERYRAIGGAARSRTWMQIAADILDRPVIVLEVDEVAALGAALMGARAAGILDGEGEIQALVEKTAKVRAILEPRPEHARRYSELYEIYRDLYPATKEISHRLFALGERPFGS